jgi:hypothetical protein
LCTKLRLFIWYNLVPLFSSSTIPLIHKPWTTNIDILQSVPYIITWKIVLLHSCQCNWTRMSTGWNPHALSLEHKLKICSYSNNFLKNKLHRCLQYVTHTKNFTKGFEVVDLSQRWCKANIWYCLWYVHCCLY